MTVINVGSGRGVTVREFVDAFLEVSGLEFAIKVGKRRAGDTAGAYANTDRARSLLNWVPQLTIHQGIQDALTWSQKWEREGTLVKMK
jgi:UDP-glucose 4-epimerase